MTKIPSVEERSTELAVTFCREFCKDTPRINPESGVVFAQRLRSFAKLQFTQALTAEREAGAREERVFVLQPQWLDESPAWLCILTKDDGVIAEKVFTQPELRSAYLQKTGQYASTVITTYEAKIGALYLLKSLTPPIK